METLLQSIDAKIKSNQETSQVYSDDLYHKLRNRSTYDQLLSSTLTQYSFKHEKVCEELRKLGFDPYELSVDTHYIESIEYTLSESVGFDFTATITLRCKMCGRRKPYTKWKWSTSAEKDRHRKVLRGQEINFSAKFNEQIRLSINEYSLETADRALITLYVKKNN